MIFVMNIICGKKNWNKTGKKKYLCTRRSNWKYRNQKKKELVYKFQHITVPLKVTLKVTSEAQMSYDRQKKYPELYWSTYNSQNVNEVKTLRKQILVPMFSSTFCFDLTEINAFSTTACPQNSHVGFINGKWSKTNIFNFLHPFWPSTMMPWESKQGPAFRHIIAQYDEKTTLIFYKKYQKSSILSSKEQKKKRTCLLYITHIELRPSICPSIKTQTNLISTFIFVYDKTFLFLERIDWLRFHTYFHFLVFCFSITKVNKRGKEEYKRKTDMILIKPIALIFL